MMPEKFIKNFTEEIITEFNLPYQQVYNFIAHRLQWTLGIGYDLGRAQRTRVKSVIKMDMAGRRLRIYPSIKDAANKTGIDKSSISRVCSSKSSSAGGFRWRYLNPNEFYTYKKIKSL